MISVRDVEVAEAGDGAGRALYALGVGDLAAEHLVAGAEAEDAAAAAEVGGDVDVEAGGAEGAEVGDGGLGAGEEDEVGVAGQGGAGPDAEEVDLRARRRGGRGRRSWRCGGGWGRRCGWRPPVRGGGGEGEGVLGGEAAGGLEEGDEADRAPAGAGGDGGHAVGEEGGVAAEAVDDEGFYQGGVGGVEDGAGCRRGWR